MSKARPVTKGTAGNAVWWDQPGLPPTISGEVPFGDWTFRRTGADTKPSSSWSTGITPDGMPSTVLQFLSQTHSGFDFSKDLGNYSSLTSLRVEFVMRYWRTAYYNTGLSAGDGLALRFTDFTKSGSNNTCNSYGTDTYYGIRGCLAAACGFVFSRKPQATTRALAVPEHMEMFFDFATPANSWAKRNGAAMPVTPTSSADGTCGIMRAQSNSAPSNTTPLFVRFSDKVLFANADVSLAFSMGDYGYALACGGGMEISEGRLEVA